MNILIAVGAIMLMHLMSFAYDYADQIADGTVIKGLFMKKSKKIKQRIENKRGKR